ncbi:hypothetical protein [Hwangdonia seohaensis]|uniref:Uncharacterized protein n=1 Tax=Hwangdonia seohaensis TaxID=1240727 RepID=A0ABW3RAY3_9FLAO|nr:hypothetical protein [Hwangdonia seohaensis]
MKVFLEKNGNRIELKPHMVQLFYKELKRATNLCSTIFRSEKGYLERVTADLKVILERTPTNSQEYFIHSRAVLYYPKKDRSYQFYFGFLLIEWYKDATTPNP